MRRRLGNTPAAYISTHGCGPDSLDAITWQLSADGQHQTRRRLARPQKFFKMSMFRAKKLDLGCFVNIKVIRDHTKRKVYEKYETERYVRPADQARASRVRPSPACWSAAVFTNLKKKNERADDYPGVQGAMADSFRVLNEYRQALRYIIRNTTLPARVRAEAQLQLTQMHCYTNPTQIRNRCILGGKGRGIFSDFKMSRVSRQPCIGQWDPG